MLESGLTSDNRNYANFDADQLYLTLLLTRAVMMNLLSASSSTFPLLPVLFLFVSHSLSRGICDAGLYGLPDPDACLEARTFLPESYQKDSLAVRIRRLFVEPQYLQPPFSAVRTPYENNIVQVPKIWSAGLSNEQRNDDLRSEIISSVLIC